MLASKEGPRGGLRTPLGFGVLVLRAFPRGLGPGDFAGAIALEAPSIARAQKASFASAGGVHAYGGPRAIAAAVADVPGYTLAAFNPADLPGLLGEGDRYGAAAEP